MSRLQRDGKPSATNPNQAPPLADYDLFATDAVAVRELRRSLGEDAAWGEKIASEFGTLCGSAEHLEAADVANANPPVLRTLDRVGNRVDEVDFHPAWYRLLDSTRASGMPVMTSHESWAGRTGPAPHALSTTMFSIACQTENGHGCPISMLEAGLRCLRMAAPERLRERYVPLLADPDPSSGWWIGMGMTEAQGGSDVGANTTSAVVHGDGTATLNGHKWFTSCPTSDLILFLARPEGAPPGGGGLGLYLYPRIRPDGVRNGLRINRLKDKLGTRSMASGEIELHDAYAEEVAGPGQGLRSMLVMVNLTRLHVATGALASARRALNEAIWWAQHRSAFGATLIDQPLQQAVLADLALEVEAGWVLCIRVANAIDAADRGEPGAAELARALTPLLKYHVTKSCIRVCAEALECLGGNGYVETFPMARQLRDVVLQSIWEGTGNVIALDVLRATERDDAAAHVRAEIDRALAGVDAAHAAAVRGFLPDPPVRDAVFELRRTTGRTARVLIGALLAESASRADAGASEAWAAEAWLRARLEETEPVVGSLPASLQRGARDYVLSRGPRA